ncbi:hypothetical protein ACVWY0_004320 [Arthrobacter sp. UYNi723]
MPPASSTEENSILALTAQKLVTDADLPGEITLTEIGDTAKFTVKDGPIEHSVHIGSTMLSFSAEGADDDYDYTRGTWLYRSGYGVFGGSVLEADRARDLRSHFATHREFAILMDVMADSSFREHDEYFGELDREGRTAALETDDTENLLDLSGDEPVLKTDDGQKALLRPWSMASWTTWPPGPGTPTGTRSWRTCAASFRRRTAVSQTDHFGGSAARRRGLCCSQPTHWTNSRTEGMTVIPINRKPKGIPVRGQFAATAHGEASVSLAPVSTGRRSAPAASIRHVPESLRMAHFQDPQLVPELEWTVERSLRGDNTDADYCSESFSDHVPHLQVEEAYSYFNKARNEALDGGDWRATIAEAAAADTARHPGGSLKVGYRPSLATHQAGHEQGTLTTGEKYTGYRDASEICKDIRAELKAATEANYLPAGLKYSVTNDKYAGNGNGKPAPERRLLPQQWGQ